MADNVAFTPGTGATGATDDIGGVHYPRVKIALGADGSAVDAVAGAGAVSSAVQRVTLASDDPAVASLAAIATDTPNLGTAIMTGAIPVTIATDDVVAVGFRAEDAAHSSGDTGIMALAVRKDTSSTGIGADGDYVPLAVNASGHLYVAPAGSVAHDGADSGNPIKIGARAVAAEITPVAANDRVDLLTDLVGKLLTMPYTNPENIVSGAITSAMTGTTSTSLVAAAGAGLRNYITTIVVSNAHATVGTDIAIQDGSGGTTLMTIPAAAVYGGAVINLPVPLRQPTTNTAIFCANVTTGASTKVSAVGYKGA